jgi:hypothetical protein
MTDAGNRRSSDSEQRAISPAKRHCSTIPLILNDLPAPAASQPFPGATETFAAYFNAWVVLLDDDTRHLTDDVWAVYR